MGIVAEVKLSGSLLYGPDNKPVRNGDGKHVYLHEKEGQAVPVTISRANATAAPDRYLVWLDNMPSSGVTFYLSGFSARTSIANVPDPFRLDWELYASGSCIIEDEPVWQGSTWLKNDLTVRNGMLVQVTGLDARAWFLRVTTQEPTEEITLSGAIEYWCPTQPTIGGPLDATGSVVG